MKSALQDFLPAHLLTLLPAFASVRDTTSLMGTGHGKADFHLYRGEQMDALSGYRA